MLPQMALKVGMAGRLLILLKSATMACGHGMVRSGRREKKK